MHSPVKTPSTLQKSLLLAALLVVIAVYALPALSDDLTSEECLMCHDDMTLVSEKGRPVGVDAKHYEASLHGAFECTDCHEQDGDYEDIPHFAVYKQVNCAMCHEDAARSFTTSFHGQALAKGVPNAPTCYSCHGTGGNPHRIHSLDSKTAEEACYNCHTDETGAYDGSVHAIAAKKGKNSPGCVSCHSTHTTALPPSSGAVNKLCQSCHGDAMLKHSGHVMIKGSDAVMSCASCHDVHATHKPHLDKGTLEACIECHPGYEEKFKGSVHEPMWEQGKMNCISCHRTHQITDASDAEDFGCGQCHAETEMDYRKGSHRLGRLRGDGIAATCADCHEGHHILAATDPLSPVNHFNIPNTCGECHTNQSVITSDYVRLPISLPSYENSVHGVGWKEGKHTAVCTDCHGTHFLQPATSPVSMINKQNIATTCGQCHREIMDEYRNSVHAKSLAHGITDAPTCTDCHNEHMILATENISPAEHSSSTCAKCHESTEMAVKYGFPPDVVSSYLDSYHGWAIKRGGKQVATCEDCHNKHEIRSQLDPESSTHEKHVVETCGKCHDNSNPKFAASYSHVRARNKMMIHDWVRVIYIGLIALVLGGMAVHNLIIYIHDLGKHYKATKSVKAIRRMTGNEIWQHMFLAVSFTGLAVTGLALRSGETWWGHLFAALGMTEEIRRIIHRSFALILILASLYHMYYLVAKKRGRLLLKALFPGWSDVKDVMANMGYYLGLRKKHATFGMYDYTQKAEYWALIWGTVVMSLTGFVLMFPEWTTIYTPAWVVRVAATVHFYEAILAIGAIIIWHFFFTIFKPGEYPMSWIWITGRMPKSQWEHHHGREVEETGENPEFLEGVEDGAKPEHSSESTR